MEDTRDSRTARAATEGVADEAQSPGGRLLTARESAQILGVSVRTVRRWVTEGRLAGVRIRGARGPELRLERDQVVGLRLLEGVTRTATGTDSSDRRTVAGATRDKGDDADGRPAASLSLVRVQLAQLRAALRLSNRDRRRLEQENAWLRARIQGLEATLPDRIALALSPPPAERAPARPWWRFW